MDIASVLFFFAGYGPGYDHFFIFISFPQFIYDLVHISLTKREIVLSLLYFLYLSFIVFSVELKRLLMNQTLPTKVFSFFQKLILHALGT